MWQVDNTTPYAAAGHWIRDRNGAEVWLVAVRCTFLIRPDGTTAVAEEQQPPVLASCFRGDPAVSSLVYDSDFYLTKPTTDVLLHGHAHAPGGAATKQVDVSMRVGPINKTLRVNGNRSQQSVISGASEPFTTMPLTYEKAYGGREADPAKNPDRPKMDARNPVGVGYIFEAGRLGPNISYGGINLTSKPAGFGPIAAHWEPRVKYAGTYDDAWRKNRCPLYPLDLDDRFFLCSPEDQRPPEHLRGGEQVELVNMTPSGRLAFVLPRVAFRFLTEFRGKPFRVHRALLHTVILEPDVPRVIMVWQTALPAHVDVTRLIQTQVTQLRLLNPPAGSIPAGPALPPDAEEGDDSP